MDFHALPRRDLQALCKRNSIRANMTNVAMADALRALPKVHGIEEYVPVPEPDATAEDAPAPGVGVGRRGAGQRARLVPVVPQLAAMAEEALTREAERDNAPPAPAVGRRGPSRRARPSQAAGSEVAGAEEKQREEVEGLNPEATMDDVPALGVGRRGAGRRARTASSVAAVAGKVVAGEEQRDQFGRCVRAKGSSNDPIRLDESDDEETEDAKPEEQEDAAQILGMGRRGCASRRAPAPSETPATRRSAAASKADAGDVAVEAVPIRATRQRKPTMKAAAAAAAAAEEKAPPRATRRGALQQEMKEQPQDEVTIEDEKMVKETPAVTTCVMPENPAALDEDGDKPNQVVIGDYMSQVTVTDEVVQEEKVVLITNEMLQGKAGMHDDIEDAQFETVFVQADQVVIADNQVAQVADCEITVEKNTALIDDDRQQSTITMDEDVVEDHSNFDGAHSNEQIKLVIIENVPELEVIEDVFVQADRIVPAENLPEQAIDSENIVEATSLLVDEKQLSTVRMDEDGVKDDSETDGVHSNEHLEVVTTDKVPELELAEGVFVEADHVAIAEILPEQVIACEAIAETTLLVVDEKQKSTVSMDIDVAVNDHFKIGVVHADERMEALTTAEVAELTQADDEGVDENMPVDEKQQSTVTMNGDVVYDHFKTHVAHADEQKEAEVTEVESEIEKTPLIVDEKKQSVVIMAGDVVFETLTAHADEQKEEEITGIISETEEKTPLIDSEIEEMTPLIVDEKKQSTVTMNGDVVFETDTAHADEQKEVELIGIDSEIEEKTPLIVDEKNQSTVTTDGDVVFETDTAYADEQKEVIGIVTEVPDEVTGAEDEVVEEKAVAIVEDIPNQGTVPSVTLTMDGFAKENYFGIDFGHGNEQKKTITADIEPEVMRANDGGDRKEIALLDDVTMDPSVCKNSSGKNSAEPMAVLEEKGVVVAIKSEDLTKLSLGQLRAKLKEKLIAKKNKEAKKRVALARVDENVCRSHAKGQQQDLNLQQH